MLDLQLLGAVTNLELGGAATTCGAVVLLRGADGLLRGSAGRLTVRRSGSDLKKLFVSPPVKLKTESVDEYSLLGCSAMSSSSRLVCCMVDDS